MLRISLAYLETKQTCGSIFLLRLKLLNCEINLPGSAHTPIRFPFKKILSFPEISCRVMFSSSFIIPQSTNVSINGGSFTTELTIAVTARFFTNPHFSPSGVDKKHNFPQQDGFLQKENQFAQRYWERKRESNNAQNFCREDTRNLRVSCIPSCSRIRKPLSSLPQVRHHLKWICSPKGCYNP